MDPPRSLKRVILGIAGVLFILWASVSLAYDYATLHGLTGYEPPFKYRRYCETVVFDAVGLLGNTTIPEDTCYTERFTLLDSINLWRINASRIIIITHTFRGKHIFGIGVTGAGKLPALLHHPLIEYYMGTGRLLNGVKVPIVDYKVFKYNKSLKGKTIVIVSCNQGDLGKLAELLAKKGARVCYTWSPLITGSYAGSLARRLLEGRVPSNTSLALNCTGG